MKTVWPLILCLFFCPSADAETYFFVGSQFPILSDAAEDGELSGIAIDVATIIGSRLGHQIKMRLFPWERAKYMVKNGFADVLMAPHKNPQRETWLNYSATYFFTNKTFFYVAAGRSIDWNGDYASLRGRKVGLVEGWSVDAAFDQAKNALLIDYAPNLDVCFRKLLAKRIDMLPTQVREANAAFVRLGLGVQDRPVIIRPALAVSHNYFGFTVKKDLSRFKTEFDQALLQMKASGEITRLLKEKYGLSDEELQ